MQAFWDPAIVKHFKPADPKYATEPDTVQASLLKDAVTIPEVLKQMKPEDGYLNQIHVLQKHLFGACQMHHRLVIIQRCGSIRSIATVTCTRKQSIWHTKCSGPATTTTELPLS